MESARGPAGCWPCAGPGQMAGGEPAVGQTHCGLLSFRPCCSPSPVQPTDCQGREGWRVPAGRWATPTLCSVGPGRGALWGRAEGSLGRNSRLSLQLGKPWFVSVGTRSL